MGANYDHLVFDLDGTLVDSRADLAAAVNHVLRVRERISTQNARPDLVQIWPARKEQKRRRSTAYVEVSRLRTGQRCAEDGMRKWGVILSRTLSSLGLRRLPPEAIWKFVGEGARVLIERALGSADRNRIEDALPIFREHYGAHLLDRTRPYPGVVEMLEALRGRPVALSVLTNKPVAMSRAILDGLGLLGHFVEVIGGDSLSVRKPEPAGLGHLGALTGTPAERMLLVGDSTIDFETARAGGVAFCGVAWGLAPEDLRAAQPERIIDHPAQLLRVV